MWNQISFGGIVKKWIISRWTSQERVNIFAMSTADNAARYVLFDSPFTHIDDVEDDMKLMENEKFLLLHSPSSSTSFHFLSPCIIKMRKKNSIYSDDNNIPRISKKAQFRVIRRWNLDRHLLFCSVAVHADGVFVIWTSTSFTRCCFFAYSIDERRQCERKFEICTNFLAHSFEFLFFHLVIFSWYSTMNNSERLNFMPFRSNI